MAKPFKKGDEVTVKEGCKGAGNSGVVDSSDKSITMVKFDKGVTTIAEPVWTEHLERKP